ncbi:hypothetical protein VNO78_18117 [Psophocarpus tetragonolobus]|uniref:Uncharacterized protein n=1 Tax=Psophocarpus tetragonolobus TaxID=3891 RepID=A0AAN9SHV9_PSOTE
MADVASKRSGARFLVQIAQQLLRWTWLGLHETAATNVPLISKYQLLSTPLKSTDHLQHTCATSMFQSDIFFSRFRYGWNRLTLSPLLRTTPF